MLVIELLNPRRHDRAGFTCGEPTLDHYLREQATQHHRDGVSTTHVLVESASPARILGYYTLSAAQMRFTDLKEGDRRRLPRYPIPAARMGRLAVAHDQQGRGHGEFLLGNTVHRCLGLREQLGIRVLLVDALNDRVVAFYETYGFRRVTEDARTLYLPLTV